MASTRSPEYTASLAQALRYDAQRGEAYLQLPSYPDLRLTIFREGIEEELTALFNQPPIANILFVVPSPTPQSWVANNLQLNLPLHRRTNTEILERSDKVPLPLSTASRDETEAIALVPKPGTGAPPIGCYPFKSLWDTKNGVLAGDVHLSPKDSEGEHVEDEVLATMPLEDQAWYFGYVLHEEYHGRGIMSEVVGVIIHSWIIPWMQVGRVGAQAERTNIGSTKILLKHGLQMVREHDQPWPEDKGGGIRPMGTYEMRLPTPARSVQ